MVSDETLEKALDYLRDTADSCAQSRANRLYLDDYSRVLKATIMAEHLAEPVNAQERYAYSDTRYKNHLEGLKQAIYEDEKGRYMREAAAVKIEVYRDSVRQRETETVTTEHVQMNQKAFEVPAKEQGQ